MSDLGKIALIQNLVTLTREQLELQRAVHVPLLDEAKKVIETRKDDYYANRVIDTAELCLEIIDIMIDTDESFQKRHNAVRQLCINRGINAFGDLDGPQEDMHLH